MKKTIARVASALVIVSMLTACGSTSSGTTADTTAEEQETTASTLEIADNSVDFAYSLKMGWNLGNTLDANGAKDLTSETSWGQPTTTKELINFVKESGFTSIRIPVSWGNHTDADYNIDAAWMSRVTEVVDWALDSGMYVIINSHHDCDYYYPTEENFENASKFISTVWSQIADNFKDYDERLVFESMNEPRLMNTNLEWWFSPTDEKGLESINCIVKLNQIFVDTVRAKGGKNASRYLMVPSNAASAANALNDAFTMPTDPSNRLILSAHAYSPYDFAMNKNGYSDWDGSKIGDLNFIEQLNEKFIKNGYGVVIGEMGATNKDNLEARVAWADDYTKLAASMQISCFLWDNGGIKVGEENFGMIGRSDLFVWFPDLLEAYLKNYR